ncbi:MAG: hypothetical protein K8R36_09815, partial [Planctomycetales bacterium]|nr:hypothetical protein [Planctomycetales bacterium]
MARWLLGGGLVLVAGLAGVYFYLESTRPRPDPTPPATASLGEASSLDDEGDLPDADPSVKKGTPADKGAPKAKAGKDSQSPGKGGDQFADSNQPLPDPPVKAKTKPADESALPESTLPDIKPAQEKLPPLDEGKEPKQSSKSPPVIPTAQKKVVVTDSDKPLFEGWKDPAAVIMLTGEMHGYLEPCGCSLIQYGGLARRDDLLRQIREVFKWQATGFDLGGLINRPHRSQAAYKYRFAFDALVDMKYAGVAMGAEEMKLDIASLLGKPAELELLATNATSPQA